MKLRPSDAETIREQATRLAIDAVYHERENGGTMHTAGEAAADVVLRVIKEHLPVDDLDFDSEVERREAPSL